MDINHAIKQYSIFLNRSWESVHPLLIQRDYSTDEDSINDWLQANWELLVERKILHLNEYLEVYGDGADFNGSSSRITDPDAEYTFEIIVGTRDDLKVVDVFNDEIVNFAGAKFDRLVGFKDGYYRIEPNFQYALVLDDSKERVIELDQLVFSLKRGSFHNC